MIERIAVCVFCVFVGWVLRGVVDTIRRTRRAERATRLLCEQISPLVQELHKECQQGLNAAFETLDNQLKDIALMDSQHSQRLAELEQERDRLLGKSKG